MDQLLGSFSGEMIFGKFIVLNVLPVIRVLEISTVVLKKKRVHLLFACVILLLWRLLTSYCDN
jgi:hypothetical protein